MTAMLKIYRNDFARYFRKPNSPYVQLIVIPLVFVIMMLFDIIGANGSKIIYGELLWDPLLIINEWTSKVCALSQDPEIPREV
jgi:NCS1 family nucleobase:cation symporter-1